MDNIRKRIQEKRLQIETESTGRAMDLKEPDIAGIERKIEAVLSASGQPPRVRVEYLVYHAILSIVVDLKARVQELVYLRVEDNGSDNFVDLANKKVTLRKYKTHKSYGDQVVAVTATTCDRIAELIRYRSDKYPTGKYASVADVVFLPPSTYGAVKKRKEGTSLLMTLPAMSSLVKKVFGENSRDLRVMYATANVDKGAAQRLATVASQLRHAPDTTLTYYARE